MVRHRKKEYNLAQGNGAETDKFAREIVWAIRAKNPPGRFLRKNELNTMWYDIGDAKAIAKTTKLLLNDQLLSTPAVASKSATESAEREENKVCNARDLVPQARDECTDAQLPTMSLITTIDDFEVYHIKVLSEGSLGLSIEKKSIFPLSLIHHFQQEDKDISMTSCSWCRVERVKDGCVGEQCGIMVDDWFVDQSFTEDGKNNTITLRPISFQQVRKLACQTPRPIQFTVARQVLTESTKTDHQAKSYNAKPSQNPDPQDEANKKAKSTKRRRALLEVPQKQEGSAALTPVQPGRDRRRKTKSNDLTQSTKNDNHVDKIDRSCIGDRKEPPSRQKGPIPKAAVAIPNKPKKGEDPTSLPAKKPGRPRTRKKKNNQGTQSTNNPINIDQAQQITADQENPPSPQQVSAPKASLETPKKEEETTTLPKLKRGRPRSKTYKSAKGFPSMKNANCLTETEKNSIEQQRRPPRRKRSAPKASIEISQQQQQHAGVTLPAKKESQAWPTETNSTQRVTPAEKFHHIDETEQSQGKGIKQSPEHQRPVQQASCEIQKEQEPPLQPLLGAQDLPKEKQPNQAAPSSKTTTLGETEKNRSHQKIPPAPQQRSVLNSDVPFCKKCQHPNKNLALHHPWCPKNPQFVNSGADEILRRLEYGCQVKCERCVSEYNTGRCVDGSLQHNELCMNSQKKLKKSNNEELPRQSKSKAKKSAEAANTTANNNNKRAPCAMQKSKQRDSSKGSAKVQSQLSTTTISKKRAPVDRKAETELGIPTTSDSEEDQKTVEEEECELFHDFGDNSSITGEDGLTISWVSCDNPWGPGGVLDGDVVLYAPYRGIGDPEALFPSSRRFVSCPFSKSSRYLKTHRTPDEGLQALTLTRDVMCNRPWGFTTYRHEFGGACLVARVDPSGPASAAVRKLLKTKSYSQDRMYRSLHLKFFHQVFVGQEGSGLEAGLRPNDMIIAVNGKQTGGMSEDCLQIELDVSGQELLLVVARYKFPVEIQSREKQEEMSCLREIDASMNDERLLDWTQLGNHNIHVANAPYPLKDINPVTPANQSECLSLLRSSLEDSLHRSNGTKMSDEEDAPTNNKIPIASNAHRRPNCDETPTDNPSVNDAHTVNMNPSNLFPPRNADFAETEKTSCEINDVGRTSPEEDASAAQPDGLDDKTSEHSAGKSVKRSDDDAEVSKNQGIQKNIGDPPLLAAVAEESSLSESDKSEDSSSSNSETEEEDDGTAWMGCVCGKVHRKWNVFWIQCDACHSWYNAATRCIGFDRHTAENMSGWLCPVCAEDDNDGKSAESKSSLLAIEPNPTEDVEGKESRTNQSDTDVDAREIEETDEIVPTEEAGDRGVGLIKEDRSTAGAVAMRNGTFVSIREHSWVGVNNPAGIAMVLRSDIDDDGDLLYDIKYVIGRDKRSGVLAKYLQEHHF